MATRTVIEINEDRCNGCGLCAEGCPEGALQIIDGKARLVGESLCDGLGACIGDCPQGAITRVEREAAPYCERSVIENIIPKGNNTLRAHLMHLKHHGQDSWYEEALAILREKGFSPEEILSDPQSSFTEHKAEHAMHTGCPGSRQIAIKREHFRSDPLHTAQAGTSAGNLLQNSDSEENRLSSRLEQWPIQLHLINPRAPYFKGEHLLIAADCTAFAFGAFHPALLAGKKLIIACPKLDSNKEIYIDKIAALIDEAEAASITVAIMEVPCCSGLLMLVKQAMEQTARKPPVTTAIISIQGEISWK